MAEGLSASEVGKEIAEHHREHTHTDHDRLIGIIEAVVLSIVALLAAWSGFSAAKWSTDSSITLAKASATRAKAGVAQIQGIQIRTLDSVEFNAVVTAFTSGNKKAFALTVARLRPAYRKVMREWIALRPLKNPHAPPGPSYMPDYRIPQEAQARALDAAAAGYLADGQKAAHTADKYVQLTVLLAAVLFLVGIGSRFPIRVARIGLLTVAGILLFISIAELLSLPGPPA